MIPALREFFYFVDKVQFFAARQHLPFGCATVRLVQDWRSWFRVYPAHSYAILYLGLLLKTKDSRQEWLIRHLVRLHSIDRATVQQGVHHRPV